MFRRREVELNPMIVEKRRHRKFVHNRHRPAVLTNHGPHVGPDSSDKPGPRPDVVSGALDTSSLKNLGPVNIESRHAEG